MKIPFSEYKPKIGSTIWVLFKDNPIISIAIGKYCEDNTLAIGGFNGALRLRIQPEDMWEPYE